MTDNQIKQIRLGVNLDHVVSLREARHTEYPDFCNAIKVAESAGADGITIHLREDRRHIQTDDVYLAREHIKTTLNLEMAATEEMGRIASEVKPDFCCIVPEKREELTTEGGLDVIRHRDRLTDLCAQLIEAQIQVSLFIEPEIAVIDAVLDVGAPLIELHTGQYANAQAGLSNQLSRLTQAAEYAERHQIIVNAGHGLHLGNVRAIANIPQIVELNIGHAIVADAVFVGLSNAIQRMKQAVHRE